MLRQTNWQSGSKHSGPNFPITSVLQKLFPHFHCNIASSLYRAGPGCVTFCTVCFTSQFSSVAQACPILCDPMNRSMPGLPVHHQLPEFTSHLILCHPLLLRPPINPSIRVFSNESTLRMKGPKYWSFSFSIIPSKEHPWLISFKMDWLALLAVQGTLKSLLQHHSSKASILQCSAFFTVQLSHP